MLRPRYVERGGEQVYCPPFAVQGSRWYGFALEADRDCLQRNICDRYFNQVADGQTELRPALPLVLLSFATGQVLQSTDPEYHGRGWFSAQEASFSLAMFDAVRQQLYWTFPYMWVDNPYSMIVGREIYGYPKELGWLRVPADPRGAELFELSSIVLPSYSARTEASRDRLIEIRAVSSSSGSEADSGWSDFEGAAAAIRALLRSWDESLGDPDAAFDPAHAVMHSMAPGLLLKQFRDATGAEQPCYQALLEVPIKPLRFRGGGRLGGEYAVSVSRFQSHPICEDLGLPSASLRPLFAIWLETDIEIGRGREIWRARTPAGITPPPFAS